MPKSYSTPGKEGYAGQGHTGYSKYDAANAPVESNGGNTAEHDGIATEQSPESMYGGNEGSLKKSKEV